MTSPSSPSVLVLGAGLQGVCAALALQREGFRVTLVDRATEPLTRASRHNEGKIHLGFVYAKDETDRTAQLMLHAALRFAPLMEKFLRRPIPWDEFRTRAFTYLVLNDSMLPQDKILEAYYRLQDRWAEELRDPALHYLGERPNRLFSSSPDRTLGGLLEAERVLSVIPTAETSLAVERFRGWLTDVLRHSSAISTLYGHRIRSIERTSAGFRVAGDGPEGVPWTLESDRVVNCLWDRRLEFDEQLGLLPRRPWVYRLKLRLFADLPPELAALPSLTMVVGRYGDIVVDPPHPAYLSWYPAGLRGWSDAVRPPEAWEPAATGRLPPDEAADLSRRMIAGFESIIPGIATSRPRDLAGGVIFSWGQSDIDDPDSELHRRHDIGVEAHDGYFTINTGKFTCAPLFAEQLVRQVQAARSCP